MQGLRRRKQYILLVGDIAAIALAAMIFASLVPDMSGTEWVSWIFPFVALTVLFLYTAGLYSPEVALGLPFPWLASSGMILAATIVFAGIGLIFRVPWTWPLTTDLVYFTCVEAVFCAWRFAISTLARRSFARTKVALVGQIPALPDILVETEMRRGLGYDVELSFADRALDSPSHPFSVTSLESFEEEIERRSIDVVVVGASDSLSPETKLALFDLLGRGLRFMSAPDFFESLTRRVPIGIIDELWFLENIDLQKKRSYSFIKRIIDLVVGSAIFLVLLPFSPFFAFAVKLSSQGPVFFTQVRLGRKGKPFTMIKFRTMRTDSNDFKPTKKDGDPRITKVGAFLRAMRIDELPQILNVLRGDMSIIGPRPERPELAEQLEKEVPYYRQRLLVKPGLTGWDQVSGEYHSPSVSDTYLKLQYDLYYIKYMSPLLDGSILFKTIKTVLGRAGV